MSWSATCMPRCEGDLGLRNMREWSKCIMIKHLWCLIADGVSVWSRWIKLNFLRERSIWSVSKPQQCSWNWSQLLKIRHDAQMRFKWRIANGHKIYFWYVSWSSLRPLYLIWPVHVLSSYVPQHSKLSQVMLDHNWNMPNQINAWFDIDHMPMIHGGGDACRRERDTINTFSSSEVWESVQTRMPQVTWHFLIWSSSFVPGHSFICWPMAHKD